MRHLSFITSALHYQVNISRSQMHPLLPQALRRPALRLSTETPCLPSSNNWRRLPWAPTSLHGLRVPSPRIRFRDLQPQLHQQELRQVPVQRHHLHRLSNKRPIIQLPRRLLNPLRTERRRLLHQKRVHHSSNSLPCRMATSQVVRKYLLHSRAPSSQVHRLNNTR